MKRPEQRFEVFSLDTSEKQVIEKHAQRSVYLPRGSVETKRRIPPAADKPY
jgi:hypothetical protein